MSIFKIKKAVSENTKLKRNLIKNFKIIEKKIKKKFISFFLEKFFIIILFKKILITFIYLHLYNMLI